MCNDFKIIGQGEYKLDQEEHNNHIIILFKRHTSSTLQEDKIDNKT